MDAYSEAEMLRHAGHGMPTGMGPGRRGGTGARSSHGPPPPRSPLCFNECYDPLPPYASSFADAAWTSSTMAATRPWSSLPMRPAWVVLDARRGTGTARPAALAEVRDQAVAGAQGAEHAADLPLQRRLGAVAGQEQLGVQIPLEALARAEGLPRRGAVRGRVERHDVVACG